MSVDDRPSPLQDYWYPVALSADIGERPVATKLMDVPLVVWRTAGGIHAFHDLCIHRGTQLSLGWVDGDRLVCPYHGWSFAEGGAVVRIPSLPSERPIPAKARARRFECCEQYGLVFVCLGVPKRPIYPVPEFASTDFATHIVGPVAWKSSAPRSLENFMDEAHLPWAHPGTLGSRDDIPAIPNRAIEERENGFYYETLSEVRDRTSQATSQNRLTYDIEMPFTIYHENIYPGERRIIDLLFITPVSDRESVRYMIVARNFDLDQSAEKFIDFTHRIWEQDRILIESQKPELLPVDWDAELHLRGPDGPSVAYRRKLLELGVRDVV